MSHLKQNIEKLFPQFKIVSLLRQNQYKYTYKVKRAGNLYILKLFNLEGIQKDRVLSIVKVLNKLSKMNNPHLVKFYEASFDQELTYLGIITDYIQYQYEHPLEEQTIWLIMRKVVDVLGLLHPNRFHGKIIQSNLFHQDDIPILGEMNIPYLLHKENYHDIYLLAPEFVKSKVYDCKSDIWMLGYMIYSLMFNEPPALATNIAVIHKKVMKGVRVLYNPNYSHNLNNLIKVMLCYDPVVRPTIEQLMNIIDKSQTGDDLNYNHIMPKYKLEKVVLHKKRDEKKADPIVNIVYLNEDRYRKPQFPPSKLRRTFHPLQTTKEVKFLSDIRPAQKTAYSLQLPKMLHFQYSKLKLKTDARKESTADLDETKRMQNSQSHRLQDCSTTKLLFHPPIGVDVIKRSPQRLLFEQQVDNVVRQRLHKYQNNEQHDNA